MLSRIFARPGVTIAGAAFAAVMTGIVANALLLQKGHHPSPLFSPPPAEVTAAEPSRPAVPVPPPAPRQVAEDPTPAVAEPAPAQPAAAPIAAAPTPTSHPAKKAAVQKPAPHAASAAHKPAAAHPDLIGQLLGKQDGKLR